jgi:hypothetical protein
MVLALLLAAGRVERDAVVQRPTEPKADLLADGMSITLLLIIESFEMLLDLKPDHHRRLVDQVVLALFGVHDCRKLAVEWGSGGGSESLTTAA